MAHMKSKCKTLFADPEKLQFRIFFALLEDEFNTVLCVKSV